MLVPRPHLMRNLERALARNRAVTLLGPRQCGKTTVARQIAASRPGDYFDLENPVDLARLSAPMTALEEQQGLVVIDEAQRRPDLFEILRVLIDAPDHTATYLLTGSASPRLVKNVSESLAGRVALVEMSGFNLEEVGADQWRRLWPRGGFPPAFLAPGEDDSFSWRLDFIRTFLERDIPQLGISIPATTLRRFWTMLAHYHGQVWNGSEFARSLGVSQKTAARYLDILSDALVVRQLLPWHENLKKRQVKAPKVYVRDSGLLHALLGIATARDLERHPKLGASWEGFVVEQVAAITGARDLYFWATHGGAELDLLLFLDGRRIGIEIKYMDAPRTTRSMRVAVADLRLDSLLVVYPGKTCYALDPVIHAVGIPHLATMLAKP